MEITNHGYERFCERILKVEFKEIKTYIEVNKEDIKTAFNELFENSVLFHTGAYFDQNEAKFYINGKWVMVVNSTNQAIITIYGVAYGFSENVDQYITKDIMENVSKLYIKRSAVNEGLEEIEKSIDKQLTVNIATIESLERQIEILKSSNYSLLSQKTIEGNKVKAIEEEINREAFKVIYSMNYNMDKLTYKSK